MNKNLNINFYIPTKCPWTFLTVQNTTPLLLVLSDPNPKANNDTNPHPKPSRKYILTGSLRDIPEGSAEGIALSLLGQVGAGRLPPADQLPWLVSLSNVRGSGPEAHILYGFRSI